MVQAVVRAELVRGYEGEREPELVAELRTTADGAFAWPLLRPDGAVVLRLTGHATGYATRTSAVLVPPGEEAPQDLEVRFDKLDARLHGAVTDATGAPIEGATVQLFGTVYALAARTDAEGRYALAGPGARGTLRVMAFAPGHTVRRAQVSVVSDQDTHLDFQLAAEVTVRGTIRDDAGRPIAGAAVRSQAASELPAISDAAGAYVLGHLDPLDPSSGVLWLRCRGFVGQDARVDLSGGPVTRDFTLAHGVRVSGVVLGDGGRPLAGAQVRLGSLAEPSRDDGGFVLTGVPAGEYVLLVERRGFAPHEENLNVGEGGVEALRVQLERGGRLRALVTDPAQRPLAGVTATFRSKQRTPLSLRAATDAQGRLDVGGVPRSGVVLDLSLPGHVRLSAGVAGDEPERHFVLPPAGLIRGQVVDGQHGRPIPRFRIRFVPVPEAGKRAAGGYGTSWVDGHDFAHPEGLFATDPARDPLAVGRVVGVEASAEGYASAVEHVTVRPPPAEPVVFRLRAGALVVGRVLDAARQAPIAGATVTLSPAGPASAVSDASGAFALAGVPAGEAKLRVEHPAWPAVEDGPFEVLGQGQRIERIVRMHRGAALNGRVLDASGAPAAGAELELTSAPGAAEQPARSVAAGEAGQFAFARLAPGAYRLAHVMRVGHRRVTAFATHVDMPAAAHSVDLDPRRGNGVLRLRVTRDGLPVAHGEVTVTPWPAPAGAGWAEWGVALEAGEGAVVGLAPGRYLVAVHGIGGAAGPSGGSPLRDATRVVDVRADGPTVLAMELSN
jgi:protocatechuate 3,4-dioxygenase beta subunit